MLCHCSGTESLQNQTTCLPCYKLSVSIWLLRRIPPNLLIHQTRHLSNTRVAPFDFNPQQDVAEILQVVLDELKGVSLAASRLISNTQRAKSECLATPAYVPLFQRKTFIYCHYKYQLDIQTSLNQFLSPEILSSQNKWFCPLCKTISESTRETCVTNSAPILAIQLCRFSNQGGQLVKEETLVGCT